MGGKICQDDKDAYSQAIDDTQRALGDVYRASAPVTQKLRHQVEDNIPEIFNYFRTFHGEIRDQFDIVEGYSKMSDDDVMAANKTTKEHFLGFRHVVNIPDLAPVVKIENTLLVPVDKINSVNTMVINMGKRLSFESRPMSSTGKVAKMARTFQSVAETFYETGYWDKSVISLTERYNNMPVIISFMLASESGDETLGFLSKMDPELRPGATYSTLVQSCKSAQKVRARNRKEQEQGDTSGFNSQEANLDRLFYFFITLYMANNETPNKGHFARIVNFLGACKVEIVGQDAFKESLAKSPIKWLNGIEFSSAGQQGNLCRFHHPLLITPKRFANGAACLTGIRCTGQCLNVFSNIDNAVGAITELDRCLTTTQSLEKKCVSLNPADCASCDRTTLSGLHVY